MVSRSLRLRASRMRSATIRAPRARATMTNARRIERCFISGAAKPLRKARTQEDYFWFGSWVETPSFPNSLAAYPCGFTFYVTHPLRSIPDFLRDVSGSAVWNGKTESVINNYKEVRSDPRKAAPRSLAAVTSDGRRSLLVIRYW